LVAQKNIYDHRIAPNSRGSAVRYTGRIGVLLVFEKIVGFYKKINVI
jgi:hypothetical protein